jgi:hypothetical protein
LLKFDAVVVLFVVVAEFVVASEETYLAKRMITVILNEISGRHALRPGGPDGRVLRPLWLPELVFLAR